MIQGFVKIIFYALLAFIIYQTIRFFQTVNKVRRTHRSQNRPSGVMVKDDICNTYLPKDDAIKETSEGKEYYFCSQECRKKFVESKKK
jgi:YHS domain-containing protein